MNSKQQSIAYLPQYLGARAMYPWIAANFENRARSILHGLGGISGSWRTDYSECTYSQPQLIDGVLVDLSTGEKVRNYYEGEA